MSCDDSVSSSPVYDAALEVEFSHLEALTLRTEEQAWEEIQPLKWWPSYGTMPQWDVCIIATSKMLTITVLGS